LVTQAPAGNPLGAAVNNMVSASFYFQPGEPFTPAFTATLRDFRATFSINGNLFYDQTFVNGLNFVTFTNGILTDLSTHFQPGTPIIPGDPRRLSVAREGVARPVVTAAHGAQQICVGVRDRAELRMTIGACRRDVRHLQVMDHPPLHTSRSRC
jgi:hypothetical protein